jgi:hypothetical protein
MLPLTQTDIQRLVAESWIDTDLAQKARLYRVDGETGDRLYQYNANAAWDVDR